ncbi:MAG: translation initiation factor [Candidatus Methylacidiphilales bacterium]|nr:translation initiation factor [Candidatus Methylacidiphilales bacterium]
MAQQGSKKKIHLDATPGPIHNPFAALDAAGLPVGPSTLEPAPDKEKEGQDPAKLRRGRVVLRRETAQRGGKTVVVAGGFEDTLDEAELAEWARALRKTCGCGGTVREREIEIQGDQPGRVAAFFRELGFRVAGVVQ